MSSALDVGLLASAVRALWGAVPTSLRAFSVELDGTTVRTLAVFTEEAPDDDLELICVATSEIIADFPHDHLLDERAVRTNAQPFPRLIHRIFERYEPIG